MSESNENRILEKRGGEEVTSNTVHFMTLRNLPYSGWTLHLHPLTGMKEEEYVKEINILRRKLHSSVSYRALPRGMFI